MKVTCQWPALADAAKAVKGLAAKDAVSPFSRVRLDASGRFSLTASNGLAQVEWSVGNCLIAEQGTVTVPGAAFAAFVDALPDGDVEIHGDDGKRVKLMTGAGCAFRLAAGEAANFPVMQGPKAETATAFAVGADILHDMLRKTRFAAATEGVRRVLEGVNVDLKDGILGMTATDGRRLAHVERECLGADRAAAFSVTLPTKAVAILCGLLEGMAKRGGGDVDAAFDGEAVRFVGDVWCLTAKAVADAYPKWRRVVPEKTAHRATLRRAAFLEAIGRAALAEAKDGGVTVSIEDGRAAFAAKNDVTSANVEIDGCKVADGAKAKFRVNPRLMREALETIGDDTFDLCFDDAAGKPLALRCSLPWVAVVMPYRVEG